MRRTHGEEVFHLRGLMSSGRFLGDGSERVPDYTAGQESAWWRGQRGDCRALRFQPMDFFSAGRLYKPGKQKNNALPLLYKVCIERCRCRIERCRYCIERRYSRYSRYCIERCTIGNVTITINDNVCFCFSSHSVPNCRYCIERCRYCIEQTHCPPRPASSTSSRTTCSQTQAPRKPLEITLELLERSSCW